MLIKKYQIANLGKATIATPIKEARSELEEDGILVNPRVSAVSAASGHQSKMAAFELAGPRPYLFFDPATTKAAIVTCGGLCPGLNAVIRATVLQLWHRYRVRNILGIRYGYQGFGASLSSNIMQLAPESVVNIQDQGGTILGSSRGTPGVVQIADDLERLGIQILFAIGGDGTMRGARELVEELARRNLPISVIGIPKSIDNDIPHVKRCFGFESAVEIACRVITAAHEEARGARRGVGLVKLMGRHSGYIAANATLATGHVNYCLVPEVPFTLEGSSGLLANLTKRLDQAGHAVIVVAEGAGQEFFTGKPSEFDESGNKKLHDIGSYLRDQLNHHFKRGTEPFSLKYIDPSYIIRSTPANSSDRLYCAELARNAVHAGMAGKTGMLIGYWHGRATHLPFQELERNRQTIRPDGDLWFNVIESTGQPKLV